MKKVKIAFPKKHHPVRGDSMTLLTPYAEVAPSKSSVYIRLEVNAWISISQDGHVVLYQGKNPFNPSRLFARTDPVQITFGEE